MTLFGQVMNLSLEDPAVPLTSTTLLEVLGGQKGYTGKVVNETNALGMSGVWRAVTLMAGVAASLPFHAYRKGANGERILATGQAAAIMDQPHPDMTPFEFWETVHAHRLLWGNAYLRILRNRLGQVAELWPIHPSRVQVGRTSDTGRKIYAIDGGKEEHDDTTVLHLPAFGYDGICGVSPIRAARQSIGLGLAAEEYGAKLFGSGSLATGILQTEQRLSPDQADALQRRWKQRQSGLSSAHETVVLDSGAKFHQLTIPPEDAQFIESRRFQITEMCRWFGIPPFLMFETEKSTSWGTGLEQQALGWVMYDLRRFLVGSEQRMTKLLRPQAVYAHYTVEGLLRGDSAARSAFYRSMWDIGAFSTNEIRELEEKPPVEGGDVHYRPLNMGALGEVDQPTQASQTTQEVPA